MVPNDWSTAVPAETPDRGCRPTCMQQSHFSAKISDDSVRRTYAGVWNLQDRVSVVEIGDPRGVSIGVLFWLRISRPAE